MKFASNFLIFIFSFAAINFCSQAEASSDLELMAKAQNFEKEKKWADAENVYLEVLSSDSLLKEYAHYFLALNLLKEEKSNEAKKHFEKVLELSPNLKLSMESQFGLAKIYIQEKAYAKAKNYLRLLERRNRHEEIYPQILWTYAQAEKGLNNQAGFCRWIKKIYSKFPEFSLASSWTLNLKENLFEGKPTQCLVNIDEQKTRIKNLQWSGLSEKVKSEIDTLKKNPTAELYEVQRLEVYYLLHEGDVRQALDLLNPYYEQRKNDFNYLMTLASVAARAGEVQAAVGSYYRAAKIGGRSKKAREALYQSAFMSYQFQDYDGAWRRFNEFIKIYPNSGLSRDAKWHLAWIRYLKKDYEGAFHSLNLLRDKKSKNFERVEYWKAMALLKQKKWDEAKIIFEHLSRESTKSYYSVAAQFRLKKLETILPKRSNGNNKNSRLALREKLLPSDEENTAPVIDVSTEEAQESEETIVSNNNNDEAEETTDSSASIERPPEVNEADDSDNISFSNPVLLKRFDRAKMLVSLGMKDWAKWDLYDIERKTSNRDYLKKLISEYESVENFHRSSYIGQVQFGHLRSSLGMEGGRSLWESTYPRAYSSSVFKYAKLFDVPFEMVWAIMRAESQYKKDVVSPVGALGLMQVMPGTGKKISQLLGENNFVADQLLEPETAVKIGTRYLQRLLKKFDGSIPLVAASYNAGPHRVKAWLSSFGFLDLDEFIEHIPFLETRNYVKKVIINYSIYNSLYGNKKDSLVSLAEANQVRVTEGFATKETWDDL